MTFLGRIRQTLSLKVPNQVGVLCYIVLTVLVLILALVLLFPEQTGNFIIEHDIRFLQ